MHYYPFNVGDYISHTAHLDIEEDLAYRRMLDWIYTHESPLPLSVEQIAKYIRMRSHTESIANVLNEFFDETEYGYEDSRAMKEIAKYKSKSKKAKASARKRWDANALRTQSKGNAKQNQEPRTNNQRESKPKAKRFEPPTLNDVVDYALSRNQTEVLAKKFFDYFDTGNWKDGKGNQVKNWKQKFITWENHNEATKPNGHQSSNKPLDIGVDDYSW